MKICPACGRENRDENKFCNKCGTKFEVIAPEAIAPEGGKTVEAAVPEKAEVFRNGYAFDEEDVRDNFSAFENEETEVIDTAGSAGSVSDFENEETVVIDTADSAGSAADFENEETVIIDTASDQITDEPAAARDIAEEPPKAPDFGYAGEVPVYRDPQNDVESDTAYIDHLRRLKGLLDDGIINEWEFEQKKQQILGLHEERSGQK